MEMLNKMTVVVIFVSFFDSCSTFFVLLHLVLLFFTFKMFFFFFFIFSSSQLFFISEGTIPSKYKKFFKFHLKILLFFVVGRRGEGAVRFGGLSGLERSLSEWCPVGRSPRAGGDGWGPEGWEFSKFRAVFPLPLPCSLFFSLSLGVFSWNSGGVFEGRDPQMCTFGNSTRRPPEREKRHEKTTQRVKKRAKMGARGNKARNFGRSGGGRVQGRGVLRKQARRTHTKHTTHAHTTQHNHTTKHTTRNTQHPHNAHTY